MLLSCNGKGDFCLTASYMLPYLTHWDMNKMADILQMTLSNAFL